MNKSNKFSAAWKHQAALLSLALCFACPHAFAQEGTADPAPGTETKATPKVYVDPGNVTGGDLGDNDTVKVSSHCVATIKDPPISDDDMDVTGPTWSWSGSGSFLDDGTPDPDPTASGSAVIAFADAANPSTDYSVTFDAPGDYVDVLTATATYTETLKTGKDAGKVITVSYSNIPEDDGTNDGNPGMPDPDFAIITPSATPSASSSASSPHGTPAGNGAPPAPKPAPKIAAVPSNFKRPGKYVMIGDVVDPQAPFWVLAGTSSPSHGSPASVQVGPLVKVLGTTYTSTTDKRVGHIIEKKLNYNLDCVLTTKIKVGLFDGGDVHAAAAIYAAKNGVQMYSLSKGCAREKTDISLTAGPVSITVGCIGEDSNSSSTSTVYPEFDNTRSTHSPNDPVSLKISIAGAASCETSSGFFSDAVATAGIRAYSVSSGTAFKFLPGR